MRFRPLAATKAIAAAAVLLGLQGCAFFFVNSVQGYSQLREVQDELAQSDVVPEIDLFLNASGGDAISVYLPAEASKRFRIAEEAAAVLGAGDFPAQEDYFEPDTATVQLDRRLVTRSGDAWTMTLETSSLQSIVRNEGYDGFDLIVCHPGAETRFEASRTPDYAEGETYCLRGFGWAVGDDPLKVTVTMVPDSADYFRFLAGAVLGTVLFSALAWVLGDLLRRGPFRRRSAGAVALGLVVGILVGIAGVASVAAVAAAAGPADNLALANDLGVGMYALSVGLPAIAGMIPGILFATLLVRRRPWPDEPEPELWRTWPAPPPPGGPSGPPPPPPIPWGVR